LSSEEKHASRGTLHATMSLAAELPSPAEQMDNPTPANYELNYELHYEL